MATKTAADQDVQSVPDSVGDEDSPQALFAVLGTQIVRLREARGWSQSELAQRLGVRPGRLGHWERGEHSPPLEMLLALRRELGVSFEELLAGKEAPPAALSREKREKALSYIAGIVRLLRLPGGIEGVVAAAREKRP